MIKNIIELLSISEHYGISEKVDIAKGFYELPNGWKDAFSKIKRHSNRNSEPITWKGIFNKIIKRMTHGREDRS